MFWEQLSDDLADDTAVWRYTNLEKLLALLAIGKLHLARLDTFDDPWEGELPTKARNGLIEEEAYIKELRHRLYVSCWHESPYESAALWEQYAGFGCLAIRSTIGRLKRLDTKSSSGYGIRRVNYVDFEIVDVSPMTIDVWDLPCFKRRSFVHEREVRVVVHVTRSRNPLPSSVFLKANLEDLIESLWLSPKAPVWLVSHVAELLRRFGLPEVPVRRSDLYDPVIR